MITDINSEDRLVQETFAEHLHKRLGWDSIYAWNNETFGPEGTLGRTDTPSQRRSRSSFARLPASSVRV